MIDWSRLPIDPRTEQPAELPSALFGHEFRWKWRISGSLFHSVGHGMVSRSHSAYGELCEHAASELASRIKAVIVAYSH